MAHDDNDIEIDLSVEEWESFYEELFGGFENLADTVKEDEEEKDELETVPKELKTKSGYLKDGFVVEDNISESTRCDEESVDELQTELNYEQYSYSDED